MFACNLTLEITNLGIKIKSLLCNSVYESDARLVDDFLCQYDYKCVNDKEELINSVLETFNTRRCAKMSITDEALQYIKEFCALLEKLKAILSEINYVGFYSFKNNNREYFVKRDVFNWVIAKDQIIFLFKENGKYTEDNLVALDNCGNVIWDSKKGVDCPNRMGAVFVSLNLYDEATIVVTAYVGINYYIDIKTGIVTEKKIVK